MRRHPIHGESLGGLGQQLGVTPHKATRRPLAAPCRALPPCCQLPWRGPRPAPLMTRHKAARRPVAAPYCGALRSSCGALRQAGSSSAKQCTDTTRSPTVSLCPMSGCSARSEWSRRQPPAAILHLPSLQASQWGPGYMPATSKPKKVRLTLGHVSRIKASIGDVARTRGRNHHHGKQVRFVTHVVAPEACVRCVGMTVACALWQRSIAPFVDLLRSEGVVILNMHVVQCTLDWLRAVLVW